MQAVADQVQILEDEIAAINMVIGASFAGAPAMTATSGGGFCLMVEAGIEHKGFALINILQPCVSFNRVNTFKWYADRVYKIDVDSKYDASGRLKASQKAQEWGNKIPIGLIYRNQRPTLEEQLPAIADQPLVAQQVDPGAFSALSEIFKQANRPSGLFRNQRVLPETGFGI